MLRLSKLADYAIFILITLGRTDSLITASALSVKTGIPEPTVAKLLKTLTVHKILQSSRGARGGYSLVCSLGEISVAQVIDVVDGPVMLTACCDGNPCTHIDKCNLSGQWDVINLALREVLEKVSIADVGNPEFAYKNPANIGTMKSKAVL